MSVPPTAQGNYASSEWPPAVHSALAAALAYVLPKDRPCIELHVQGSWQDSATVATSFHHLLEQRGISLLGEDLALPEFDAGKEKHKAFTLPFASESLG